LEDGQEIIRVENLVRKFGDFTAVDGISFGVRQGEIFGFLGPNGAGKTTTISMLCTLLRPTSGRAIVTGYDVATHPNEVRECIGVIFQDPSLDDRMTGLENLRFHALLYNVPKADFEQRSAELLEMVELADRAKHLVRTYSGGMKRRLEIARGLIHHPRVLFLDEPTIGLDPQTRWHIWEYLLRLRQEKQITMYMTTHYMDEAENCDRIAVIDHGRIVALDTPEGLKQQVGGDIIAVRTTDNELAAEKLREVHGMEPRPGPDGQLLIETEKGDRFIPHMMETFANRGTPVEALSVSLRRPTLEDVFIKLTGHAIREEEADEKDRLREQMRFRRGRM
jgi:ABC-2 type transport system ATP-binding protein